MNPNSNRYIRLFFTPILLIALSLGTFACKKGPSLEEELEGWIPQMVEMAELGTVEYTINKIVSANDNGDWYKVGDRMILFSTTCYIKAGIPLDSFSEKNVQTDVLRKTATVTLPHAKLLSFNMPPDEVKLTYKKVSALRSDFDAAERTRLLTQAEQRIRASIATTGIYQEAEQNATEIVTTMLKNLGFEIVKVQFV